MQIKPLVPAVIVLVVVLTGFLLYKTLSKSSNTPATVQPTPTPATVEQLSVEDRPKVAMTFSPDGHYVTVKMASLKAAQLEYNLIYDATVKKNPIQTGVSGSAQISGTDEYSNKQLLGSESSGKFTYHENIKNAVMELTLRNTDGYSIYSGTYPFTVSAGKTVDLSALE